MMIPHFMDDFKKLEAEAIESLRSRTGGRMKSLPVGKKKKVDDEIADIVRACGIKASDKDKARLSRHVRNLIEQESIDIDRKNAEEVVLNTLKRLGLHLFVEEYRSRFD